MPKILLIRHGETHGNLEGRLQGQEDSPLTLKGITQAVGHAKTIARLMEEDPDDWHVTVSPLGRCMQTAAIICETTQLPFGEAVVDPRLVEVGLGEWSGALRSDVGVDLSDGKLRRMRDLWCFAAPGGEGWEKVALRLGSWLAERAPTEKLIVVSHGLAGRVLRTLYTGQEAHDSPQDGLFLLQSGDVTFIPDA